MTDQSMCSSLSALLTRAFFVIFLLSGCSTSSQPVPPVQQEANLESSPETTAKQHPVESRSIEAEILEKNSIFFSPGSGTVSHGEKSKLRHAAKLLRDDKRLHVTLLGHANDNGSTSLNLAVADARVESVAKDLKKFGVKSNQVKKQVIVGASPLGTCRLQECRRKMRRVDLVFSKTD